jgi:hypothetical protein
VVIAGGTSSPSLQQKKREEPLPVPPHLPLLQQD